MTEELYDDCNWKNERVVIGTSLLLPSELNFKLSVSGNLNNPVDVLKLVHKEGLGGLMDRIQSGKDQFPITFRPSDEKSFDGSKKNFYEADEIGHQTAFEKWREGLDWGDKKKTDDNCTGDLILP